MAKGDSADSTPKRGGFPKRGAFPTPRNILAGAKPFEPTKPDKSGLVGDPTSGGSDSRSDSQEELREQPKRESEKKSP